MAGACATTRKDSAQSLTKNRTPAERFGLIPRWLSSNRVAWQAHIEFASCQSRYTHSRCRLRKVRTMRALFSVFLALGLCVGSIHAGPVRTARNVARNTAVTAKNVADSMVKGTRRAVHTVVSNLTP